MRRSLVLLAVVAACRDVPLPSDPTGDLVRRPRVARSFSNLDWVQSTTGVDMLLLGQIDGHTTTPIAINDAGQIVGWYEAPTPVGPRQQAFVWENGLFTALGTLEGGTSSITSFISNSGVIVGLSFNADDRARPVVWERTDGEWVIRELPGLVNFPFATGIAKSMNAAGEIVGAYTSTNGLEHATKWTASGPVDLGTLPGMPASAAADINSSGTIVGQSQSFDPFTLQQTMWIGGVPSAISLPNNGFFAYSTDASKILNDAGDFIGYYLIENPFKMRGLVSRGGQVSELPTLVGGTIVSLAHSINERGDVAGFSEGNAVIWPGSGEPIIDLGIAPVNGNHSVAHGINNRGLATGLVSTFEGGQFRFQGAIWRYAADTEDSPPIVSATVAGTLGNNGWYVSDVQVSWNVVDPETGVSSTSGCETTNIIIDTPGQRLTCSAVNGAGVTGEGSVVVKRDVTPPTVGWDPHPATFTVDQTISIDCPESDATSGLFLPNTCPAITGEAYTFALGPWTFSARADDNAGNFANAFTNFTVVVTFESLANLTRRFTSDPRIGEKLVKTLRLAEEARARGNTTPAELAMLRYIAEVEEQSEKTLTADEAAVLKRLASAL
jgi:probable HAF family extracellular repeat protein